MHNGYINIDEFVSLGEYLKDEYQKLNDELAKMDQRNGKIHKKNTFF